MVEIIYHWKQAKADKAMSQKETSKTAIYILNELERLIDEKVELENK